MPPQPPSAAEQQATTYRLAIERIATALRRAEREPDELLIFAIREVALMAERALPVVASVGDLEAGLAGGS